MAFCAPFTSCSSSSRDTAVAGVGFAADSYDLFVIGIVLVILEHEFAESASLVSVVASSSLAAAVVGQLLFGYLATRFGRVRLFVVTLCLIVGGTLASAAVFDAPGVSVFAMLAVTRCVLGLGIGGEYPLAATISKEKNAAGSNTGTVMVFAMQGVGIMVAAVLFLLLAETGMPLAYMWRILLAFGAVPGIATMYWRVKMQETADYLAVTDRRLHAADWAENRRALCGTAGTWFLLDVTLYGNGVFAAKILKEQISGEFGERLARTSIFNLAVAAIGFLGYIAARFTIDRFPKRRQQIVGFVAVAIVFFALGALVTVPAVGQNLYLFAPLYGLTFFLSNWGPNTTTYVLPTIVFRARVRPFFHGISAAVGKLGAVVGTAMVAPISDAWGTHAVFYISGGVALLGALWSLWLPAADPPPHDYHELGDQPMATLASAGVAVDVRDHEGDDERETKQNQEANATTTLAVELED
jgi:PHS family inorganic phosphate transporter-like MFS transporter